MSNEINNSNNFYEQEKHLYSQTFAYTQTGKSKLVY